MYGNMAQVAARVVEPGPNVEGVFEELNMSRFNRNPAVLTCNNFRLRRFGLGDCLRKVVSSDPCSEGASLRRFLRLRFF